MGRRIANSIPPEEQALYDQLAGSIKIDESEFKDPSKNSASNLNGLSDFQRFVVQNFFDTQPKRRKAYLDQLGYEMSKDGESIRPKGYDGSFKPIDPGFFDDGFFPIHKLLTKDGLQELKRDFTDIAYDLGSGAAITSAATFGAGSGAATGGAAGSVVPGPGTAAGAIAGALAGGFAAGAGANAAAETMKWAIGEFILDEDVPMDLKETLYQSLAAGALGAVARGGKQSVQEIIKNWQKVKADKAAEAIKEGMQRASNNAFSQDMVADMVADPQKFSKERIKGATNELLKVSDEIFGTSVENPKSTRQLTGGVARKVITPLNERADLEIQKLAKNPEANFTIDEIENVLLDRLDPYLSQKYLMDHEEKSVSYILDELGRFAKSFEGEQEIPFDQGRRFLKGLQNAVYNKKTPLYQDELGMKVTRGLKELADKKAGAIGSDLPQINDKRSEILQTYKNFQEFVKQGHMQNAYVGKGNISRVRAQEMFNQMDEVLGTNLSERVQSLQFQSALEEFYRKPGPDFGSGSLVKALKGSVTTGFKRAGQGAISAPLTGVDPITGAKLGGAAGIVEGFKKGLRGTGGEIDSLLKDASKIKVRMDDIASGNTLLQRQAPAALAAPSRLAPAVINQTSLAPEPEPNMSVETNPSGMSDEERALYDELAKQIDVSGLTTP